MVTSDLCEVHVSRHAFDVWLSLAHLVDGASGFERPSHLTTNGAAIIMRTLSFCARLQVCRYCLYTWLFSSLICA